MKGISTINPAITENTEFSIIKMHAITINIKVGVYYLIVVYQYTLFCFQLFKYFGQHSKLPASTELVQVSHQSHNARTANRHLHSSGERNGA